MAEAERDEASDERTAATTATAGGGGSRRGGLLGRLRGKEANDDGAASGTEGGAAAARPARRGNPVWLLYERHKERMYREQAERIQAEMEYADRKAREQEQQMMETEEKLAWDAYELPRRNRLRLIRAREEGERRQLAQTRQKAIEDADNQEEGLTFANGCVKDFSRWRDDAALFRSFRGHTNSVYAFRVSSDLNFVVSASEDSMVKLWDFHSGKCLSTFEGHAKAVRDCDIYPSFTKANPEGGLLVSCSADKTIHIWDIASAQPRKVIRGHTDVVYSCRFAPDGRRIASASADHTVRLWDTHEGHLIFIYDQHDSAVVCCDFSPSGRFLVSASDYGERRIHLCFAGMPHMRRKRTLGFRLLWETTGVIRRVTACHDPSSRFFRDVEQAEADLDAEDQRDAEEESHSTLLAPGTSEDEEEDAAKKQQARERELERQALELPDTPDQNGFSLTINSVDRFGRSSQVNSYYMGATLKVSLRGADPFQQFFLAAHKKKRQFDCFKDGSGERVGTFAKETESLGTRLTCDNRAMASRPAMPGCNEATFTWNAPTVVPGQGEESSGVIVFKATLRRDPLSIGPDEEDPGLIQLSCTLKEVEPPSKGSVLSELSQKVEKEAKQYDVDVTLMHQLFIDFLRNQDLASASTLLSPKCTLHVDDNPPLKGHDEIVTAIRQMHSGSVVMKDAKQLIPGVTHNSIDFDEEDAHRRVVDGSVGDASTAAAAQEDAEGAADKMNGAVALPDDARRGSVASWRSGSFRLRAASSRDPASPKRLPFAQPLPGKARGNPRPGANAKARPPSQALRRAKLSVQRRAWSELSLVLTMRKHQMACAEEVRLERTAAAPAGKLELSDAHDDELVSNGKFGMGIPHLQMPLPVVYPLHAVSYDAAAAAARKGKENMARAQRQQESTTIIPRSLGRAERKELLRKTMDEMVTHDREARKASARRRNGYETLPALERFDHEFASPKRVHEHLQLRAGFWSPGRRPTIPEVGQVVASRRSVLRRQSTVRELSKLIVGRRSKDANLETDGTNFDRFRRRSSFTTLPGFNETPKPQTAEDRDVEDARQNGGLVRVFFVSPGRFTCHHNTINQVVFSQDERRVASCSTDGMIRMWDPSSGALLRTILSGAAVLTVSFSDEGQRLISGGLANELVVWNVTSGEALRRFSGHDDAVFRCCFFGGTSGMVSCSMDKTIKTWYLTPQPPAAPEKPVIAHKTRISMVLTWRAPPSFNEPITAFHIQNRLGLRNDFGDDITTHGKEYKRTITGLLPGQPYQFRVRAVNRMGEGCWSEPSAQTLTEIDVPRPVERPVVRKTTSKSITITWSAPTATVEGGAIVKFIVQMAGNGVHFQDEVQEEISWNECRKRYRAWAKAVKEDMHLSAIQGGRRPVGVLADTGAGELTFTQRAKIARLECQARARTAKREADLAAAEEACSFPQRQLAMPLGGATEPGRQEQRGRNKTAAAAVYVGDAKSAPKEPVSTAAHIAKDDEAQSKKKAKRSKKKGSGQADEHGADKKKRNKHGNFVDMLYTFEGLDPGLEYQFRIAGVSSVGQGGWSPASFSTLTEPTRPAQPEPPTVDLESVTMRSMCVHWTVPDAKGSAVVYFNVRKSDGAVVRLSRHVLSLVVDGLHPGHAHSFQVQAVNSHGVSNWSRRSKVVHTLTDRPCVPTRPKVVSSDTESITLHVDAPFDNGNPITCFVVQRREISKFHMQSWGNDVRFDTPATGQAPPPWLARKTGAGSLSMKLEKAFASDGGHHKPSGASPSEPKPTVLCLSGLLANTTYDFRVAAVNAHGQSEWSGQSLRSRTAQALVPDAVQAPTFQAVFAAAVVVNWKEPAANGATVSGYLVEWQRVSGPTAPADVDGGESGSLEVGPHPLKRIDLQTNCTFRLRVAAKNAAGWGPLGAWSGDVTPSEEAGL